MNVNFSLILCVSMLSLINFLSAKEKENLKLETVINKALQYAALNPGRVSSMKNRIRKSALLPKFRSIVVRDIDADISVKEQVGDADTRYNKTSNDWRLMWYAEWDLRNLIFHPNELDLERISFQAFNLRSRLIHQIVEKYFERKLIIIKMKTDLQKYDRVKYQIDLEKNTEELNAYTGGWFSRALGQ